MPLRAHLHGHSVVAGQPVPTDDLIPIAVGPSKLLFHPSLNPLTLPWPWDARIR